MGSTDRSLLVMMMALLTMGMPKMPDMKGGAPNSRYSRHHDVHPALRRRRKKKGH